LARWGLAFPWGLALRCDQRRLAPQEFPAGPSRRAGRGDREPPRVREARCRPCQACPEGQVPRRHQGIQAGLEARCRPWGPSALPCPPRRDREDREGQRLRASQRPWPPAFVSRIRRNLSCISMFADAPVHTPCCAAVGDVAAGGGGGQGGGSGRERCLLVAAKRSKIDAARMRRGA